MPKIPIDTNFINEWKDRYDEDAIGGDYAEYIEICKKVSEELLQGMITKSTFIEILYWKSPRLKGIVRLDEFEYYEEGIKKALEAPKSEKLSILDELYGIGVPTASTILHFFYPLDFPIMDIRVAETLFDRGYLKTDTRSARNYVPFCEAIKNISHESGCSIRDIDKAIFAYHKVKSRDLRYKCE